MVLHLKRVEKPRMQVEHGVPTFESAFNVAARSEPSRCAAAVTVSFRLSRHPLPPPCCVNDPPCLFVGGARSFALVLCVRVLACVCVLCERGSTRDSGGGWTRRTTSRPGGSASGPSVTLPLQLPAQREHQKLEVGKRPPITPPAPRGSWSWCRYKPLPRRPRPARRPGRRPERRKTRAPPSDGSRFLLRLPR